MIQLVQYALLGVGVGALYALVSQGLIVVYRGSGVLNFASGAIGISGAFLTWQLGEAGMPFLLAAVAGVLFSALIGAACHLGIMRVLRTSSPLARVVATLGIMIVIQAVIVLLYSSIPKVVPSQLPIDRIPIGEMTIPLDRTILLGIALLITVALTLLYKRTRFGLATAAVAENERVAASLAWSPNLVAAANWALGSALSGLAAILIVPIVTLQVSVMTQLVLAAIAAALVARFQSFAIALAAGVVIGVAQTLLSIYVPVPGFGDSVPFIVIILLVALTGRALPTRDFFLQRLPRIGTGRISWVGIAIFAVVMGMLLFVASHSWVDALTVTMCVSIVLLSTVVVTGYAGQLSLGQFAVGGFGAWIAGRAVAEFGVPLGLAVLAGIIAAIPLGLVFALPAVRTRGINLAVITLGLAGALELMVFNNPDLTGGLQGTAIGKLDLFGWPIDTVTNPANYGLIVLGAVIVSGILVANLRRGRAGRRLLAVRTNERAAAALGVNVISAKLYAFGFAAALAALGGILLAFRQTNVNYHVFDTLTSITDVGLALVGGVGFLAGPMLGAVLTGGGIGQQLLITIFSQEVGRYVALIAGVSIVATVLLNQDGMAHDQARAIRAVARRLRLPRLGRRRPAALSEIADQQIARVEPRPLQADGISVRFGAVAAVTDVCLTATPGRILGVIGPNGAGKTTLIDALTGFVDLSSGSLRLGDHDLTKASASTRARAGFGRSFQSLELFEDLTVLDNLRIAADDRSPGAYLTDLVWPVAPPLPSEVAAAVREFGLQDDLDRTVDELSFGKRRLLAIARAVATQPSVLLLDEPAAGLGDVETAELARLVRRLADEWGMAVLLVEHDMNFVMSVCDELMVLNFGEVLATGSPEQIRSDPRVIDAYLGTETEAVA